MKFKKEKCKIYNIGIILVLILVILLFFTYNKKINEEKKVSYLESQYKYLENFSDFYMKEYKNNIESIVDYLHSKIEYEKIFDENYKKLLIKDWENYKKNNAYIRWIYIASEENMIIDSTWKKPENYNLSQRAWYQIGLENQELTWSEPYEDLVTKKVFIAVTKGIKNNKGKVDALFAIDIDLEKLSEVISNFDINQENFIYDENYRVFAHTNSAFLNKNIETSIIVKKLEASDKNYVYDEKGNVYVAYKSNLGWTIVKKIPGNMLENIVKNKNRENLLYIYLIFIIVSFMHILFLLKRKKENRDLIFTLRKIQNRENIEKLPKEYKKKENIFQEFCNIQSIIENLEKETYIDQITGLYTETYLDYHKKELEKSEKKLLLIQYKNLSEIKNQYGKSVVELVLKRGAMTLKVLKENNELVFRINRDTLAIVLNPNEIEKKTDYIIAEILNYKWKLYNIYINLSWEITSIEEYANSKLQK